jgi:hypothetical protein
MPHQSHFPWFYNLNNVSTSIFNISSCPFVCVLALVCLPVIAFNQLTNIHETCYRLDMNIAPSDAIAALNYHLQTPTKVKWLVWPYEVRGCIQKFPDWPPGAELQMEQLSATRCSCITILWLSLVSFPAVTLCVASQRVIPKVSVHFVIDSVRKLLDTS